jgi:hypothetical protein
VGGLAGMTMSCLSAKQEPFQLVRGCLLHVGEHVRVHVHGHGRAGMSKSFSYHLRVLSTGEQQCRTGVAEVIRS